MTSGADWAEPAPPYEPAQTIDPPAPEVPTTPEIPEPSVTSPGNSEVVSSALARIVEAVDGFHTRAERYESIIRQMQSRIEDLQGDQVRQLLAPLIQRFAALHTEAGEARDRAQERNDQAAFKDFGFFVSEIEEGLAMLDVESIDVAVGDAFEPAKHAARRSVPTSDPALDKTVAKVLRQGFTYVGAPRVFMPAQVTVHRYSAPE